MKTRGNGIKEEYLVITDRIRFLIAQISNVLNRLCNCASRKIKTASFYKSLIKNLLILKKIPENLIFLKKAKRSESRNL